jgi:hypothetical protein
MLAQVARASKESTTSVVVPHHFAHANDHQGHTEANPSRALGARLSIIDAET